MVRKSILTLVYSKTENATVADHQMREDAWVKRRKHVNNKNLSTRNVPVRGIFTYSSRVRM